MSAPEESAFPGALRVVDGEVHVMAGPDHLVYVGPEGQGRACLPTCTQAVGYAENVDLHVLPAPDGKPLIMAGFGCSAPSMVGGHVLGEGDWFAHRLRVLNGDADPFDDALGSYQDIWTGQIGDRWVVATGADTSIQVRDLVDGQMISVRMTGAGEALRDDNTVSSVAICGDVVSLAFDNRLEIRRWADFSAIQIIRAEELPRTDSILCGSDWLKSAPRSGPSRPTATLCGRSRFASRDCWRQHGLPSQGNGAGCQLPPTVPWLPVLTLRVLSTPLAASTQEHPRLTNQPDAAQGRRGRSLKDRARTSS